MRLRTFGGLSLVDALPGSTPRRRALALLALVAESGNAGITREKLCAIFWPDSETEQARNALKQAIFAAKRDLKSPDIIVGTSELRLNSEIISSDLGDFKAAVRGKDPARAVDIYEGPFLDGVQLRENPEFDRWVDTTRAEVSAEYETALRHLAAEHSAAGNHSRSAEYWRRLVQHNPYSSSAVIGLMQSLALTGDHEAALSQAAVYERMVRTGLEMDPDPDVFSVANEIRKARSNRSGGSAATPTPLPPRSSDSAPRREELLDSYSSEPAGKRKIFTGMAVGAALLTLFGFCQLPKLRNEDSSKPSGSGTVVAVAPFRLVNATPASRGLGEGMMDLIAGSLSDESGEVRSIDPASFLNKLGVQNQDSLNSLPIDRLRSAARAAGATRLVSGSVVENGEKIVVTTSMVDVATGNVLRTARTAGALDSLLVLTDRISVQLLAAATNEQVKSVVSLASTPLVAVQDYLAGKAAFRRGQYKAAMDLEARAVELDTTFALAALELVRVAGWVGEAPLLTRGYKLAWAYREKLDPADRAFVRAVAGPRYPDASTRMEWLNAWKEAATLRPERPEAWFEVGDLLFHNPWLEGQTRIQGLNRSRQLFQRALDVSPGYVPAIQHLIQIAASENQSAEVKNLAARLDDLQVSEDVRAYLRWRTAVALSSGKDLKRARPLLDSAGSLPLAWVTLTVLDDSLPVEEATWATMQEVARAKSDRERIDGYLGQHAAWLNAGDYARATAALSSAELFEAGRAPARQLRVLDVLFAGVPDNVAARQAVSIMESSAARDSTSTAIGDESRDLCVAGYWYARTSNPTKVTALIQRIRALTAAHPGQLWSAEAKLCARILELSLSVEKPGSDLPAKLAGLDQTLSQAPNYLAYMWDANCLAAADLFERAKNPKLALAAARRRGMFYRWPHFLRIQRRKEARLAAINGR